MLDSRLVWPHHARRHPRHQPGCWSQSTSRIQMLVASHVDTVYKVCSTGPCARQGCGRFHHLQPAQPGKGRGFKGTHTLLHPVRMYINRISFHHLQPAQACVQVQVLIPNIMVNKSVSDVLQSSITIHNCGGRRIRHGVGRVGKVVVGMVGMVW